MPNRREVERTRFEPHAKDPRGLRDESEFELDEDDEEFQELVGDSSLEEEPIPEDAQEDAIEQEAGGDDVDEGPPRRERMAAMSGETGRRWLYGATETDPVERLEDEEEEGYRASDSQLDIRRSSRWSGTRDGEEGVER